MKNLIRKLYKKLEGYFVSKWWERKIYNELRNIYEQSGEILDINCTADDRWAIGFEDIRERMGVDVPHTVTVYESDWGRMTYIPSDNSDMTREERVESM